MKVSKSDILWSYGAQFFSVATGVIVLPMILKLMSTQDIALYYVIMNIGSLITVFDFGFSPQFSRNFAYVFNGAQSLVASGVDVDVKNEINYSLLKTLISTAKKVYLIISIISLLVLLTVGSIYIYSVSKNFQNNENVFFIWVLYSISIYFNLYYMYLTPLVRGMGKIKETQQATVFSRIVYLVVAFVLLAMKFGLMAIVIANIISPFVSRFILLHTFYTKQMKEIFENIEISNNGKKECFKAVWYNAKKMGIISISSIGITKSGMFFSGLYLSAPVVAAYGLLQQLVNIITGLANTMFNTYTPKMSGEIVQNNRDKAFKDFKLCMGSFYIIFIFLSICMILAGPWGLKIIKANAVLPTVAVMIGYCLINFLEQNHSLFASYISLKNDIPFMNSSVVSSIAIIIGTYFGLSFTKFGIWILIIIPGVVQLSYNNWYWPRVVCKENDISFIKFVNESMIGVFVYVRSKICRLFKEQK